MRPFAQSIAAYLFPPFAWTTCGPPFIEYAKRDSDDDDFIVKWQGMVGRVEQMDDDLWWWAVYDDDTKDELNFDSTDGVFARDEQGAMFLVESLMKLRYLERGGALLPASYRL